MDIIQSTIREKSHQVNETGNRRVEFGESSQVQKAIYKIESRHG